MVYVFLATGYEEVEALTPVDVLRRAGVEVNTVSIYDTPEVASAHGVSIKADITLNEVDWQDAEMLVLPGGLPGSTNLNDCQPLRDALKAHCNSGRWTAAICAAPLVLGGLGLLNGKHATCYPGFEKYMDGADHHPGAGADIQLDIQCCVQQPVYRNHILRFSGREGRGKSGGGGDSV